MPISAYSSCSRSAGVRFGWAGLPPVNGARFNLTNDTHEKDHQRGPSTVTAFRHFTAEGHRAGMDTFNVATGDFNIGNEAREMELNFLLKNLQGIDFATLGNHEQDAGSKAVADGLSKAGFKVLASNLVIPPTSRMALRIREGRVFQQPVIAMGASGARYGFVGLTVPEVRKYLNPAMPMEGVDSLPYRESLAILQQQVAWLERQGVNRIILLSHCGFDKDVETARSVSGIDIIFGGHSHTELEGIVPGKNYLLSPRGEPVIIAQTGKDARALGVLDTAWDALGRVEPLQNRLVNPANFPADPVASAWVDTYLGRPKQLAWIAQEADTEGASTEGENAVANAVADAMREATGAQIALVRGNELRNKVEQGPLTDRDLRILLPFNDKLVTFRMPGQALMAALNESARCLKEKESHPGIVHGSGLRYTVDKQSGKAVSAQVYNARTARWEPLNPQQLYTVTMGSFIADNPYEYPVFKQVPIIKRFGTTARDAFGAYLLARRGQPIRFINEGRLNIVEGAIPWPSLQINLPPGQNVSAFRPSNAFASARGYTTSTMS